MNAKVSIIVPVYNTAKYLPACIESILNQTYENLEIIFVDDGSTDDSNKILASYAKKDSRVKIINQKNSGQSAARNKGLKYATGDFISFIDSDDEIASTFISDLFSGFKDDAALSVCGIRYKRLQENSENDVYINQIRAPKKSESKSAYILYLLTIDGRMYSSVNKLYRANLAKELSFDESLNFAEDTKFVLDYLKATFETPYHKISFVLKPLYVYNFGTEVSTIKKTALSWDNWQTSYQNLKDWLGPYSSATEKFWLHMVHLRWRISHRRSVRRAKNAKNMLK